MICRYFLKIKQCFPWGKDAGAEKTILLKVGENSVKVRVWNQRTFTGGIETLGGHKPEGWSYSFVVENGAGVRLLRLSDGEDRPQRDGPRHGKQFTAATFTLIVDPDSAVVTVQDLRPRVW
jgi:hypothetical protein